MDGVDGNDGGLGGRGIEWRRRARGLRARAACGVRRAAAGSVVSSLPCFSPFGTGREISEWGRYGRAHTTAKLSVIVRVDRISALCIVHCPGNYGKNAAVQRFNFRLSA